MNTVSLVPDIHKIKRILCSVYDKAGLIPLISGLFEANPDLIIFSTGGTYQLLRSQFEAFHDQIVAISTYTGQKELQGGLVKTLDYKIYLSLLTEPYNSVHQEDMKQLGAQDFDLVVCNLYPFSEIVAKNDNIEAARAYIDIGGPTMVRAAAKNFHRIGVLTQSQQYESFLAEVIKNNGCTSLAQRFALMQTAFREIAEYDRHISDYFSQRMAEELAQTYQIQSER